MTTTGRAIYALLALAATLGPATARAAEIEAEAGLVSEYRFRGISLSDGKPAAQASLELSFESGIYAGSWGSTIKEPGSAVAAEIQLYGGYELDIGGALSLDLSANYYAYPGDWEFNYAEATAVARIERGDLTAGIGYSFVPRQRGTRDESGGHDNHYLFAEASYQLPGSPISLQSSIGHERGYFDEVEGGGKWDWSLGGEAVLKRARFGLLYVGSDRPGEDGALIASLMLDF